MCKNYLIKEFYLHRMLSNYWIVSLNKYHRYNDMERNLKCKLMSSLYCYSLLNKYINYYLLLCAKRNRKSNIHFNLFQNMLSMWNDIKSIFIKYYCLHIN